MQPHDYLLLSVPCLLLSPFLLLFIFSTFVAVNLGFVPYSKSCQLFPFTFVISLIFLFSLLLLSFFFLSSLFLHLAIISIDNNTRVNLPTAMV